MAGNIFGDGRLMQMAGLAVMSGKPLGEAIQESSQMIAQQDLMQQRQQQYQYEVQQQQQAQIANQRLQQLIPQLQGLPPQEMFNVMVQNGVDPQTAISYAGKLSELGRPELVLGTDANGNPILVDKASASSIPVNPVVGAQEAIAPPPDITKGVDVERLQMVRDDLLTKLSSPAAAQNPKLIANYEKQLKSIDDRVTQLQGLRTGAEQGMRTIGQVDELLAHPGFESAVGAKGISSGFGFFDSPIAGTQAADFNTRLEQIKGTQFLEAYKTLKGGGTITEVEGKKAEASIARMNTATSEAEFKKAAEEFKGIVTEAAKRAAKESGVEFKTKEAPKFQEGQTATNPQTGKKITFTGGRWQ